MAVHFKQVAIVGVGLIGASLGMVLRRKGLADSVIGIGRSVENLRAAVEVGAIDRYVSVAQEGVRGSSLIILATPVGAYERHLREWGLGIEPKAIVTDVGSVKGSLVERAERLVPDAVHFVGAHPIAGREKTGAAAGSVDLFKGTRCILTPTRQTDPAALQVVRQMWEEAGAIVSVMNPFLHDRVLAAVSHLPHVVAFSLINALGEMRERVLPEEDLLAHAGGGLRDTTRIAASSPEMWRDICVWNRENLVAVIETYERHLRHLKQLIAAGDGPGIQKELEQAKRLREQLN